MPSARRRRRLIALATLIVLSAIGASIARHYTRPETLTALLVDKARDTLGAELVVGQPGRFELVPKLHLVLPQASLGAPSANARFLTAQSVDVVVPWKTLWSSRYEIERIDIVQPRIDLDALDAWRAARPSSGPAPDVRFAIRVSDASLVSHGKIVAEGIDLAFASTGDVAGWLARIGSSAAPSLLPPLSGRASADRIDVGDATLENVHVEVVDDDAAQPSGNPSP